MIKRLFLLTLCVLMLNSCLYAGYYYRPDEIEKIKREVKISNEIEIGNQYYNEGRKAGYADGYTDGYVDGYNEGIEKHFI